MNIAVISDTHLTSRSKGLPAQLIEGIRGVDLILHAGDWTDVSVLKALEAIAPVKGVTGNNDGADIHQHFNETLLLDIGSFRIGVTHGHSFSKTTLDQAMDTFAHERVDVIIFGHSHIPYLEQHGGIWVLNPGSPTDKRRQPRYSYATMKVTDTIAIELHYYDDKSPKSASFNQQ